MITKTRQLQLLYHVGDQEFKSLVEAQKFDLKKLIPSDLFASDGAGTGAEQFADWLLKNKAAIMDILSTTPRSRARARKANGATRKPRTPKTPATPPTP